MEHQRVVFVRPLEKFSFNRIPWKPGRRSYVRIFVIWKNWLGQLKIKDSFIYICEINLELTLKLFKRLKIGWN